MIEPGPPCPHRWLSLDPLVLALLGGYGAIDQILSTGQVGASGRVQRKALTLLLDLVQLSEEAPALVARQHQGSEEMLSLMGFNEHRMDPWSTPPRSLRLPTGLLKAVSDQLRLTEDPDMVEKALGVLKALLTRRLQGLVSILRSFRTGVKLVWFQDDIEGSSRVLTSTYMSVRGESCRASISSTGRAPRELCCRRGGWVHCISVEAVRGGAGATRSSRRKWADDCNGGRNPVWRQRQRERPLDRWQQARIPSEAAGGGGGGGSREASAAAWGSCGALTEDSLTAACRKTGDSISDTSGWKPRLKAT